MREGRGGDEGPLCRMAVGRSEQRRRARSARDESTGGGRRGELRETETWPNRN